MYPSQIKLRSCHCSVHSRHWIGGLTCRAHHTAHVVIHWEVTFAPHEMETHSKEFQRNCRLWRMLCWTRALVNAWTHRVLCWTRALMDAWTHHRVLYWTRALVDAWTHRVLCWTQPTSICPSRLSPSYTEGRWWFLVLGCSHQALVRMSINSRTRIQLYYSFTNIN